VHNLPVPQSNRVTGGAVSPAVHRIESSIGALLGYCRRHDWAGFDPYDALNSRLFELTPFARSRVCRIALTQGLKRLPINIRPLLGVPRAQNPKALGLFLSASVKLGRQGLVEVSPLVKHMTDRLITLRSLGVSSWCWGYSFPWQTRTVLVPRGAPNLVCTTFVATGLLDAYEITGDSRQLEMAVSAAAYIANTLYWESGSESGFSYPLPGLHSRVHNANFLAAALLYRVAGLTGDKALIAPAERATGYSLSKQADNGSWSYGEAPTQTWIDNFHTGYNLCALRSIAECIGSTECERAVRLGFEFYRRHFVLDDGLAKYFHDRAYPVDIHSVAQTIITMATLRDLAADSVLQAYAVFDWASRRMWDEQGHFHYQVRRRYTNTISYMRWSQAWMLLALATLLEVYPDVRSSGTLGATTSQSS
jgi:hypothetical protein